MPLTLLEPVSQTQAGPRWIFGDMNRPPCARSERDWLRQGYRVPDSAEPVAVLHHILKTPHSRSRPALVPQDQAEEAWLRQRGLRRFEVQGPQEAELDEVRQAARDAFDREVEAFRDEVADLTFDELTPVQEEWYWKYRRANRVTPTNLYSPDDVVPIDRPTQSQAWELISHLFRQGSSHEFIGKYRSVKDGKWKSCTYGGQVQMDWDIRLHKQGELHLGVKAGIRTRVLGIDLDRHDGTVPGQEHKDKVLRVARHVVDNYPALKPMPEVNPKNGSTKLWMVLPESVTREEARELAAELRREYPDLARVEIYPDNLAQAYLPLRRDKTTLCGDRVCPKVKAWRKGPRSERVEYMAHDAAFAWDWLTNPDRPVLDLKLLSLTLDRAVANTPDVELVVDGGKLAGGKKARKNKAGRKPIDVVVRYKGRCAAVLTSFLRGDFRPEDDTIELYTTACLRVLVVVEGMDDAEAVDWLWARLEALPDSSFSDRLSHDPGELLRVLRKTARKIRLDNGWQKDPASSYRILAKAREAWARSGFRLSDESTWHVAGRHVEARPVVWTDKLAGLMPALAQALNAGVEEARKAFAVVASHVEARNELSLSYLEHLIRGVGVKCYRNKSFRVRRLLAEAGILVKRKNGFHDDDTGYGHGNFYTLGPDVRFQGARPEARLVLLHQDTGHGDGSTYSSLTGKQVVARLVERRRLDCEKRHQARMRWLREAIRHAA